MQLQTTTNFIRKWFCDNRMHLCLWLCLGVVSALCKMHSHNNYDIFRYVFLHTIEKSSLYAQSTDGGYWDTNHYGPFFSLIITPFALCPVWLGLTLWCTALSIFLYVAIRQMEFTRGQQTFLILFCAHELLTALFMQQFNVAIAAIILLSFAFVEKEKDHWATLFIVIGTFVKLYGIVGLAFFFFSKHKGKFVLSLVAWAAILFCLPMLISSPQYQITQWQEWFACLTGKNDENLMSMAQNISLLGMVRKIGFALSGGNEWWSSSFRDIWIILPALLVQAVGYFRIGQWDNRYFRLNILAAVLMFVVLFSTGSESSGYIIALVGCCIWYVCVPWQRNQWDIALMVFAFVLTSLSPSDLFPRYLRQEWVQPYALKALPVAIIWVKQLYELCLRKYHSQS